MCNHDPYYNKGGGCTICQYQAELDRHEASIKRAQQSDQYWDYEPCNQWQGAGFICWAAMPEHDLMSPGETVVYYGMEKVACKCWGPPPEKSNGIRLSNLEDLHQSIRAQSYPW